MSGEAPITVETLLAEQAWLRALARRLVRDDARADDLVQDVWVRVLTAPPRTVRSARAWLTRVLVNRNRDVGRSETARAGRQDAVARPGRAPSAADLVARVDAQQRVAAAVLELDEPVRETVLLRFFEYLPVREVARRTGVPYETARARLARGLDALRAGLAERDSKGRRQWSAGFLALAGLDRAKEAAAAAALTGALVAMKTKFAAVSAIVVLLAVGIGGWSLVSHDPADTPAEPAPRVVAVVPAEGEEAPGPGGEPENAATSATAPTPAEVAQDPDRGSVRGRITLPDGSPAAGRKVRLSGRPARVVTTDADGRYRIVNEWVDEIGRSLYVGPQTGLLDLGRVHLRAGDEVEFDALLPEGRPVDVEVVAADDGRPLAGIWISIDPLTEPKSPSALCITGKDGRGRIDRLPPRAYRVYTASGGFRPYRARLELTAGSGSETLRIRLVRPDELVLRVVAPPAKGTDLTLTLLPLPEDPVTGQFSWGGRFEEGGVFRHEAPPPGRYRVFVDIQSVGRFTIEEVVVRGGETVELTVERPGGAEVTGVLLDPDGKPLRGRVSLLSRREGPGGRSRIAPTDAEGRFRLSDVIPGSAKVDVHIGSQWFSEVLDHLVVPAGGLTGIEVRLSGRGVLPIRVLDSPRPSTHTAELHRRTGTGWVEVGHVLLDDRGRFTARYLPAGRYRVQVESLKIEIGWAPPAEAEVRQDETAEPLEIRWRSCPEVEIIVVREDGSPVTGKVTVEAHPENGMDGPHTGRQRRFDVTLGVDGRGVMKALAARQCWIAATAGRRRTKSVKVTILEKDNPPVRLVLQD